MHAREYRQVIPLVIFVGKILAGLYDSYDERLSL
jgi:hypothetical protein